jgi:hypothetical protein
MKQLLHRNGIPQKQIEVLPLVLFAAPHPGPVPATDLSKTLFVGQVVPEQGLH